MLDYDAILLLAKCKIQTRIDLCKRYDKGIIWDDKAILSILTYYPVNFPDETKALIDRASQENGGYTDPDHDKAYDSYNDMVSSDLINLIHYGFFGI